MSGRLTGGGGVVDGWTLETAATLAAQRLAAVWQREVRVADSFSLVDPVLAAAWPVRDQRHRATCNAFAVVAAEELWHRMATGSLEPLSEELLYRDMRATPIGLPTPGGTTFLAQARQVLACGGIYPADAGPYEVGSGLKKDHVTDKTPTRQPLARPGGWHHNIATSSDILAGVTWQQGGKKPQGELSTLFYDRLKNRIPVIASFALPRGVGIGAFSGPEGRFLGEVRYPPVAALLKRKARPVFGHTVCLVGFEAAADGNFAKGRFLFRNSFGVVRQAGLAGRSGDPRLPFAAGYGHIRVADLETWCWEYLYRAEAPNVAAGSAAFALG